MFRTTNHQIKQGGLTPDTSLSLPSSIPVNKLYLSRLLDDDNNEGILIRLVEGKCKSESRISLKFDHPDNFGLVQLHYKGPTFVDYFPPNATFKVKKMLLKKSTTRYGSVHDGDWDIIHIVTEKESDCHYLFKKAIEDNYTVILAMLLEIIHANNLSRDLTLYLHDDNGTPLHRAVAEEDIKTIEALLKYNLNINEKNCLGKTSLHVAVNLKMSDVVNPLISDGADVNNQDAMNQTPLHYAAESNSLKIIDSLIKNQVKLDEKDEFGHTALHYAVAAGNVNIVDVLLKNGADCKLTDLRDRTPFHLAAKRHNFDIIQVFLKNNINFQDSQGFTPPYVAEIVLNTEFIRILLIYNTDMNIQLIFGRNIFHLACQHLSYEYIEVFLNFNIDIDAVDIDGRTALHVAVERKYCRVVELILQKNSNINMCDSRGKTALHLASELRSLSMIKLLLSNGANVDLRDEFGNTALHLTLKPVFDCFIKRPLKNNANVNLTNASGETTLHMALKKSDINENIIISILNSMNDVNGTDNLGRTALHYAALYHEVNILRRLLDRKADINAVDNNLTSPLHLACFTKNVKVVEYLIKSGANSNMRDKDGRTVFHYACIDKLNEISLCINNMKKHIKDTLNVLVEENISVNSVDIFGKTPLHHVTENSWSSIMNELLLNIGADINILDKNLNSPFDNMIKRNRFFMYFSLNDPIPLVKHIVKMKVLKLWVRERFIKEIYRAYHKDHLEWIELYENVCSREIDLMKITNLDESNITYYEFLKKSPHDVVNYTRNQNIVQAIQSDGLIKMFPIYSHFLKNHLRETQRRSYLYEKIHELLNLNFFKKLPTLCMYEVFRYLNYSELIMFFKAMKPVVLDN